MPIRRYIWTWDRIPSLYADTLAAHGAFQRGRLDNIDTGQHVHLVPKITFEMQRDADRFRVFYEWIWRGSHAPTTVTSTVCLDRRAMRFGGTRVYFICPSGCGRRVLRLAVLPRGLCCGTCGEVTWGSRRQRPAQRLVHKANKLAAELGMKQWFEVPKEKPRYMRAVKFAALNEKHARVVAQLSGRVRSSYRRTYSSDLSYPRAGAWSELGRDAWCCACGGTGARQCRQGGASRGCQSSRCAGRAAPRSRPICRGDSNRSGASRAVIGRRCAS